MTSKFCKNYPCCFCYICGECKTVDNKKSITGFVRKAYYTYFGIKLGDQDKPWDPHVVCKTCVERLKDNGQAEPDSQWDLVYQWFGGSLKIMLATVTYVL